MYKKSIKNNSKYLIPFTEGIKFYGSDDIEHVIGTMILLNKHGDVLTCRHIAERIIFNSEYNNKYKLLLNQINKSNNRTRRRLEKENDLQKDTVVMSNITFPFKIMGNVDIICHGYLDLAVIRFKNLNVNLDNYPVFSKELPEQGQSVCKLGFAFPEYSMYEYSKEKNSIIIKDEKIENYPLFPLDGIVTRLVMDEHNKLSMFETSTPGIRGQSGGPVFSPEGLVYGIQSMTSHLDLNFDVNQTVRRGPEEKMINYTPFINLGICVSSKEIIDFLKQNDIEFNSK